MHVIGAKPVNWNGGWRGIYICDVYDPTTESWNQYRVGDDATHIKQCPVFRCGIKVAAGHITIHNEEGRDMRVSMQPKTPLKLLELLQQVDSGFQMRGGYIWGEWYFRASSNSKALCIQPVSSTLKFERFDEMRREDLLVEIESYA